MVLLLCFVHFIWSTKMVLHMDLLKLSNMVLFYLYILLKFRLYN